MILLRMPERPADGNKGTFGRVVVIGGCEKYLGAPILSGKAAYRTGCGLVQMIVPEIVRNCCAGSFPEAIWDAAAFETGALSLKTEDAVLIGPGLGTEAETDARLERFLSCIRENQRGVVLDADALNLLSRKTDWHRMIPSGCVLTPHPGEMSRLTGLSVAEIQSDRERIACGFAEKWGQIVLLKGAHTVIASPTGEMTVLPYETSALAVAGSGDVLAGIITSLLAQGMTPFSAAHLGAVLHAESGIAAAEHFGNEAGVMAGDLIRFLPQVVSKYSAV